MKEGKLKPNLITNALKILTLKDITDDVYRTANAKALIKKENIKLDLNMQADRSYILVQSGALNSKSGALNCLLILNSIELILKEVLQELQKILK